MTSQIIGHVNSVQSLGTLDGPGVRFVIFMQGCNLRCGCCHNPDTWEMGGGMEYTPQELVSRAERFREYFGKEGGVTVSGGEPLLQAEFVRELFALCHDKGINTCLDTSGSIMNRHTEDLLEVTDRVLLDIKYTTDRLYRMYVGCGIDRPKDFLECLERKKIPTVIRQVIIPTLNDSEKNILLLKDMVKKYQCVEKIELLPFKKICQVKYDTLGIPFPFADLPTPTHEKMWELEGILSKG